MEVGRAPKPVSGTQVVAALLGIICATALIPPAAAWTLNQRRISETRADSAAAAPIVAARLGMLRDTGQLLTMTVSVVCGPGRLPDASNNITSSTHAAWVSEARSAADLLGETLPTDAWGRCFLVNVGTAREGGQAWLLSAGPNGLIETAFAATTLSGDDIGVALK